MSEEIKLKWETASVEGARLTVGLDGKLDKEWRRSFEATVALLGDGEWGEVAVKKQELRVSGIEPGSEERLRHFLESAVLQANSTHEPRDEDGPGGAPSDVEREQSRRNDPDVEMTERFRSFGEAT